MTKKVLLFAGFALIGSSTLIWSSALAKAGATAIAPTEYTGTIFSARVKTDLEKRISEVIMKETLKDGVKARGSNGEIIRATPMHDLWQENALQKAQRMQLLEMSFKAMLVHQANVFNQAVSKANNALGGDPGSGEPQDLVSALAKATHGTPEFTEIAKQLRAYHARAGEIVKDIEITRSHLKGNIEAGLIAGGWSQEEVDTLKKLSETSDLKLEDFVPSAFGFHIGIKLPHGMMETLRMMPLGIGAMAQNADGSFTLTYLFQPWEVVVITRPSSGSGQPKVEKYRYFEGTFHTWINRDQFRTSRTPEKVDPSIGRGFNARVGMTLISGNLENFETFGGLFGGVSFDYKSYFNGNVSVNVKAGNLLTLNEEKTGNRYLMIAPQYLKPIKAVDDSTKAAESKGATAGSVALAAADAISPGSSSWIDRLSARVTSVASSVKAGVTSAASGFAKRSKLRFNHGIMLPPGALMDYWSSSLDSSNKNQNSQGAPQQ
ncbi:MAG: hypothetical protein JNM39_10160 [Bdellovibrionaceae bacterium]|nr:hypothetical protein [Pseudobdellovibrionaceae bacterium]